MMSFESLLANNIGVEIKRRRGFQPFVLLFGIKALEKAMANNPFPEAVEDPQTLHVGFLDSVPKNPDWKRLESLKSANERFRLMDKVYYLHAPEGIGRSKLAASMERLLGVPLTDRNWRTVCKIMEMARELS